MILVKINKMKYNKIRDKIVWGVFIKWWNYMIIFYFLKFGEELIYLDG